MTCASQIFSNRVRGLKLEEPIVVVCTWHLAVGIWPSSSSNENRKGQCQRSPKSKFKIQKSNFLSRVVRLLAFHDLAQRLSYHRAHLCSSDALRASTRRSPSREI